MHPRLALLAPLGLFPRDGFLTNVADAIHLLQVSQIFQQCQQFQPVLVIKHHCLLITFRVHYKPPRPDQFIHVHSVTPFVPAASNGAALMATRRAPRLLAAKYVMSRWT